MRLSHVTTATLLAALAAAPLARAQHDEPDPEGMLAAGDAIPAFDAEGLDGEVRRISFAGKSTVLMFFLSSCPTCHKMIPEWNRAFQRKPDGLQVVGIMLDREPPGFFMTMPVEFPVVRPPTRRFAAELGVLRVPYTVRVGPDGVVQNAVKGVLDPISLGEYFRP